RGENLAEDDFADLVARQLGALEQVGDDRRAELGRGNLGERAAEFADCGTGGGDDDDVGAHGTLLSMKRWPAGAARRPCGVMPPSLSHSGRVPARSPCTSHCRASSAWRP